jgi:hypothetical protein
MFATLQHYIFVNTCLPGACRTRVVLFTFAITTELINKLGTIPKNSPGIYILMRRPAVEEFP